VEPRQLRYFVAVAEERSFTAAARRLHLSQQTVSTAVARLERRLGCRLLDRTGRRVEPTAAGEALLAAADAVFASIDAAVSAVQDVAGEVSGVLRLRYGADSERIAEPLLMEFGMRHPRITVNAWPGIDADNVAALRSGRIDAIVAWAEVPDGLSGCRIGSEHVLVALPDRHPLAELDRVPTAAIEREPLVMFPRGTAPAVWELLVAGLRGGADRSSAPIIELPVGGQNTMATEVLRRAAVCPISETLAPNVARPGLALRPIDPPFRIPLLLCWNGHPTAPVRALAREVVDRYPLDGVRR
jgi:LysR family transcriptional regulator, benzoate and cis,cis-muconate-responsive activator of ben and cat genes